MVQLTAILVAALFAVASSASKQEVFRRYNRIANHHWNANGTETPVIGIVSQTLEDEMRNDTRFANYKTYIMQSYVDWVQAKGARVVPLINGEPKQVTIEKLSKLNGVLFPGGDGDYLEYGRFIFEEIRKINDEGTYLPLWGTCMGYENMVSYVADAGWNVLGVYPMDSASLSLDFVVDPSTTKMF